MEATPPTTLNLAKVSPVTDSEKVVVTWNRPFCTVVGAESETLGTTVSTGTIFCAEAVFPLPAASNALFAAKPIVMLVVELAAGVMSKVYAAPEPAKLDTEPPLIVKSESAKPVTGSENVILTGKSAFCAVDGAVIVVTLGKIVSIGVTAGIAAVFPLPAASTTVFAARLIVRLLLMFALGVISTV